MIEALIDDQYSKINETENSQNLVDLYYTLIQLKFDNPEYRDRNFSIRNDLKKFFVSYLKSYEASQFGYDYISTKKILAILSNFDDDDIKYQFYNFGYRKFLTSGLDDESRIFQKEIKKIRIRRNLAWSPDKIIGLFFDLSSYNLYSLVLSLLFFASIYVIILVPTDNHLLHCFEIEYQDFSSNAVTNHILNCLTSLFAIKPAMEVKVLNIFGIGLLILGKVIFYVIVVNFVLRRLIDKLNVY